MGAHKVQLSPQRLEALFDLLVHHQTYFADCVRFNGPDGIENYGPPFDQPPTAEPSNAPVLQTLLYRFVLPLPGVKSFSQTFWDNVRQLMKDFASANLSDSYDHAGLGLRRTLATGSAALLEYPARGVFAQVEKKGSEERKEYDLNEPDDLKEAWKEMLQQAVHGDLIDRLFEKTAETPDLKDHESVVQAGHEYILIHVASVLHYIFVESPDAKYTQKLVLNLLKQIPWPVLKSSLRFGNAATMINAVTKLFLTKLSLTSFTNWVGLSNNPDDGMNLMQQIIYTVMSWDIHEYQKALDKLKASKDSPSDEHLNNIREFVDMERSTQESFRERSKKNSKSMVTVIFENASLPILDGPSHDIAVEYLALSSSMRDREQLSRIICKSRPDILTQTVREGVAAYDPIFRAVHGVVDLSASCQHLQDFLQDFKALFEKVASPTKNGARTPKPTDDSQLRNEDGTVEDFAAVLRKHQQSLHKFLHQIAKNGGDVAEQYKAYAKSAAANFRPKSSKDNYSSAGAMAPHLNNLISSLPKDLQEPIISAVDAYAAYLMALQCVTDDRLRGVVLDGPNAPGAGPGGFLARWQGLLDATPTTPVTPKGEVRYGSSRLHSGEKDGSGDAVGSIADEWRWPEPPDVHVVVEKLGTGFRTLLAGLAKEHWEDKK